MERRLAAILAADVAAYSRLMGEDEAGTMTRLEGLKAEILVPLIAQHHGRVVKLMGDGFLVEFASVVDALTCALAWQEAVEARADQGPQDRALRFRIGVNLGDVMVKDDDLYGDGVNVAARLEGMAEPGAVLVSRTVFNHAKGKVAAAFEDLGERELKNITEPVQVYRVSTASEVAKAPALARTTSRSRLPHIAAAAVLFVVAAGGALWLTTPWAPREEPAAVADMAFPLPDKPSVAVLPFANLSDDASQDYFADGITEDLTTHLSRYRELFVIARNSSFVYKGKPVDVKQVGRELGVAFVVEGSIRREGDNLRINAQLIDARTGDHVWAEQFDRELTDVFAVQKEITRAIAGRLAPEVLKVQARDAGEKPTEDWHSWDLYLQAMAAEATYTPENMREALRLAEKAIEQDPRFAAPYVVIARAKGVQYFFGWSDDRERTLDEAIESAKSAIRLDEDDAKAYAALGYIYRFNRDETESIANLERAVALNANDANIRLQFAHVLDWFRQQERALPQILEAIRLSPRDPRLQMMFFYKAHILFHLHDYERSLEAAKDMSSALTSDIWRAFYHKIRAANLAQLGRAEEARAEIDKALAVKPDLSIKTIGRMFNIANNHPDNRKFWLESLRKAGMPEE